MSDSPQRMNWGDAPDEPAPQGAPKALIAIAAIFAAGVLWLLLAPYLLPTAKEEPPVDPLGFITPPNPDNDAPQREFSAEVREAAGRHGRFVGVEACRECHAERVAQYEQTNHFLSSQLASQDSIRGPISGDRAQVATPNPYLHYQIEADPAGKLAQKATVHYSGKDYSFSRPFDVVIGSGLHAQTFLFWEETRLYQLPLTYSSELDEWVKSPGYPEGAAIYGRAASSGCLRCHATYLEELDDAWNSYRPESTILGISCEKCHGQGESHVAYRKSPGSKSLEEDPIVRPHKLSRRQQLDNCAQCHAGVGKFLQPPFSYRSGEPLDEFITQKALEDQQFGVHSTNQLARLRLSKCFGGPKGEMTCTTCHNPHRKEPPRDVASANCLKCHNVEACPKHEPWGQRIMTRCVDCHMPTAYDLQADLATTDEMTFPRMRDHFISRYPELSQQIEASWKREAENASRK